MGTGYTRNDTADNIADGNIINASDLDGEFDALQSAFDNSTGHTHDGTAGEGAPIEKVGPNQEVVVTATVLRPAANNTMDLGVETTNEFKDLYIDGTAYLDAVDIDGGTIDGLSVLTVDNLSLNGNTITSTNTNGNLNLRANGTGIISVDATDVNFGDSDKATFGNGSDLQIYHDEASGNSLISESGTGNLKITGENVRLEDASGNRYMQGIAGGASNLYYAGGVKLSTTSTGIDVTGNVNATGDVEAGDDLILSSDGSKITFGADGDVELTHTHNLGLVLKTTGTGDNAFPEFVLQSNEDTLISGEVIGRIDFETNSTAGGVASGVQGRINVDATDTYSSTVAGSRMEFWTGQSDGSLDLSLWLDDEQNARLGDNLKLSLGTGQDLQIYHDGSDNYVDAAGVGNLYLQSQGDDKDVKILSDDGSGGLTEYFRADGSIGKAQMFYYGTKTLETTSTGIDVTGTVTASGDISTTGGDVDITGAAPRVNFKENDILDLDVSLRLNAGDFIIETRSDAGTQIGNRIRASSNGSISFYEDTGTTPKFFWDASAESLGIGTTSFPSGPNKLAIQGNQGASGSNINVAADELFIDNAGDTGMTLGSSNTGTGYYAFADSDVALRAGIFYDHSTDDMGFRVGSATRMTLDTDGNLDVTGSVNIGNDLNITGPSPVILLTDDDTADENTRIQNASGSTFIDSRNGTANGNIVFRGNGGGVNDEYARFTASGDFGIGTASPTVSLDVVGTARVVKSNNDANLVLETTDTDANEGPILDFYRNPGQAGADGDLIGRIEFNGLNDASEKTQFATIFSTITDASDGIEDGSLRIKTMLGGTTRDRITMNATETIINDGSQDLDFRIESNGDTAAFFVNGADGNVGMSATDIASHIPVTYNAGKRSFVNFFTGGTQFVAGRSDTAVVGGDYVGGYLFKTNDASVNKFGGMIATVDDNSGNANLEFYAVSNTYENQLEGHMQLDDTGDIYLRAGGIRVGRSHGNVYTSTEEVVGVYHAGAGANDTWTAIASRDGTGADYVFRHQRRGVIKSEIEEDGSFHSVVNSYGGTSDQRLKENIVASGSQWDDIKALQVKKYSMIEDGLDAPNMLGVVAQDLQDSGMNGLVSQHFKTDTDDNPILDADGNQEEYLSVKYSVLYMKAIKALQEAMERIETLETKVTALEAEVVED